MIVDGVKRRSYKQLHNKEQLEYFKKIVPKHFWHEISDLFYEKYGIRYNKSEIENIKRTYGLYSNISKCEKGKFAEHLKPYLEKHTRKTGEERIRYIHSKIKYLEIKTEKGWVLKSHYIWEKHNGKIPENHCIVFKDGNMLNCNINNLELIDYTDKIIFNHYGLNLKSGEEMLKTNLLISKIMQKRNKIIKEKR